MGSPFLYSDPYAALQRAISNMMLSAGTGGLRTGSLSAPQATLGVQTASAPQANPIVAGNRNIIEMYLAAIDQNGNVNNDDIQQRAQQLGVAYNPDMNRPLVQAVYFQ